MIPQRLILQLVGIGAMLLLVLLPPVIGSEQLISADMAVGVIVGILGSAGVYEAQIGVGAL